MLTLQTMHRYLDEFEAVRFIEDRNKDVTIVSYMVDDVRLWEQPFGREARGSAFDTKTGECLCRPFAKFFNYHEHAESEKAAIRQAIDSGSAVFYKKIDGSMLTPVICPGGAIWWKTKKTFDSDMAIDVDRMMDRRKELRNWCTHQLQIGNTPIFEFTSPDYPIVINYGSTVGLTLLAVRDAEGNYIPLNEVPEPPTDVVEEVHFSNFDELTHAMQSVEGEEGWVCHIKNGQDEMLVKFKTAWYLQRHRALDLRERDVAMSVINDTYDDDRGVYIEMGVDPTVTDAIASRVRDDVISIQRKVSEATREIFQSSCVDRKDTAKYVSDHFPELMAPVMDTLFGTGQRVDKWIKRTWELQFRNGYNLRSVSNPTFGQDE